MLWRYAGPAILAHSVGRFDEAIALDRRAVEHDPLNAFAYFSLGRAYDAAGRLAEAETAYWKALELAPQKPFIRAILSLNLLAQGRGEEAAVEVLREPDEGDASLRVGNHLVRRGPPDRIGCSAAGAD